MIKNILLILISTLIALFFVEYILRTYYSDYLYKGNLERSLYYSSPNLTLTKDNRSVCYSPDSNIRSITVYLNRVEYDTKHHANNLGFLSDENYTKEDKRGVIFLGDSFTAGVGSTSPWIPKLNKKYKDINLYSFGVTGTGVWNFYQTFNTFKDTLSFDTIVIMAISNDLMRNKWYPLEKNNYLHFCYNGDIIHGCKMSQPVAKLISYQLDESTLLAPEEPYIYKAYDVIKEKLDQNNSNSKKKRPFILPKNFPYKMNYMKKIKKLADKLGKKVIFIHIPEKKESKAGYYMCNIQKSIESLGIKYYPILNTHHFTLGMYHKHDGHPNDKGYAYLSSIVEEILKLK